MRSPPIWLKLLPDRLVVGLATMGPVGRFRYGPGTAGTVAGLLWFTLVYYSMPFLFFALLSGLVVYLSVFICGEAEIRLGKNDPPEVVLDEFAAFPLCFAGLQYYLYEGHGWAVMLSGFALFRFFDIVKPFGIARLQRLPGGVGVVMDDVAAAAATCLCLHLIGGLTPLFLLSG